MLIYIIRHGETDYNAAGRMQGWLDIPLNANGRELAVLTGQGLKNIHFDICYTSPLSRARETAQLVLAHSGNSATPIYDDLRLREMNFGTSDGKCCLSANYTIPMPEDVFHLLFNDAFRFPGFAEGEDIRQLCKRAEGFLEELIAKPELQDKTILLSSHGCWMRAMLQRVYAKPNDFWHGRVPDNCAVNVVEYKNGKLTLIGDDKIFYDPKLCKNLYQDESV